MIRRAFIFLLILAAGCRSPSVPPIEDPKLVARHRVHTVASGETLYAIARKYRVKPQAVAQLNRLDAPDQLRPGDRLLIPGPKPAKPPPPPVPPPPPKAPRLAPRPSTKASCRSVGPVAVPKEVSKEGLSWPVDGVVITPYGKRDGAPYPGMDIAAPVGTPVLAAADGEVLFSGNQGGFGRLVIVRHGPSRVTLYAHNLENCVRAKAKVVRGQVIALVGQSGGIASPYVYFEVRKGNEPINPRRWLPP